MKILFCNYEYPPLGGGGGVVMAALAKHLARRHEITVLTSRAGDLPSSAIEDGVRCGQIDVPAELCRTEDEGEDGGEARVRRRVGAV